MQIKQKPLSSMKNLKYFFVGAIAFSLIGCGSSATDSEESKEDNSSAAVEVETAAAEPTVNKGIGPIESLELVEIDSAMTSEGEDIFSAMCTACHSIDTKMIGPALAGVTGRRSPEWIMNMILNPAEMLANDPDAKALLKEYNNIPITPLGTTEKEARQILEYLRTNP